MCKDLNFDKLPEAVAYLIEAIAEIKSLVKNKTAPPEKRIPIGIDSHKKIKGLKRHVPVDKNDFLQTILVNVTNRHDLKAAIL